MSHLGVGTTIDTVLTSLSVRGIVFSLLVVNPEEVLENGYKF